MANGMKVQTKNGIKNSSFYTETLGAYNAVPLPLQPPDT